MSNDTTLARELGAIASGEASAIKRDGAGDMYHQGDTERFAAGLTRLIDERIALSRAGEHNPPSDDVRAAAVAIGSRFRWVSGGHHGEIGEVTAGPVMQFGSLSWQLTTGDHVATYYESMLTSPSLFTPEPNASPGRAVDAPKAAEDIARDGRKVRSFRDACRCPRDADEVRLWCNREADHGGSHSDGLRVWEGDDIDGPVQDVRHKPRIETIGNGQPVEPVPGVVAVGDTFLRLREENKGRVFTVCEVDGEHVNTTSPKLPGDLHAPWTMGSVKSILEPLDFQRVPTGYVLPTVMQCLAEMRRLVAARDRMREDPATGTRGIDDCIAEMRRLAGMVTT